MRGMANSTGKNSVGNPIALETNTVTVKLPQYQGEENKGNQV
jgi:hypothetical protein